MNDLIKQVKELFSQILSDRSSLLNQQGHDLYEQLRQQASLLSGEDFKNYQDQRYLQILKNLDYQQLCSLLERKIILSLTSFPQRVELIRESIISLRNQKMKPDRIILWLADSQFPNRKQDLSRQLLELLDEQQVEIRWCNDIKPHKKYLYCMQQFPEYDLITADDDLIYDDDFISQLYLSHLQYPHAITANRVHLMLFDEKEKLLPYTQWVKETICCLNQPAMQLFATSGAGEYFPAGIFETRYIDEDLVQKLCPYADDLWLKIVGLLCDVPTVLASDHFQLKTIEGTQENTLFSLNGAQKQNDVQLRNISNWLQETFGRDMIAEKALHSNVGVYLNDPHTVIRFLIAERRTLKLLNKELKNELNSLKEAK